MNKYYDDMVHVCNERMCIQSTWYIMPREGITNLLVYMCKLYSVNSRETTHNI